MFRKKVKTIVCNGFTIPAPVDTEPANNTYYFVADPTLEDFFNKTKYYCEYDERNFKRRICHLTKENAIMHAKAMLGINPHKPD